MVRLENILTPDDGEILLKMERTNPGGSIKDRPALYIINQAEARGMLKPGGTIIESSSGNFGISLAMIGAARDYRVIILIDPKTTPVNRAMLEAFGAEVIVVTEQDDSGSYHKTRISLANQLHREIPNSFRPDQCFNKLNSEAHYQMTAKEIFEQCDQNLDALVLTVSTGGQVGGMSRYFKEHAPHVKIIAVDAVGSTIFGGKEHSYLLPGMGLSWTPENINDLSLLDHVYKVPDHMAFSMCRLMAKKEGILCGGSTGAGMVVAYQWAQLNPNKRIVCVASDHGERYLPTIYNDQWLEERDVTITENIEEMRNLARSLSSYSDCPIETANYKPQLREILGTPNTSF